MVPVRLAEHEPGRLPVESHLSLRATVTASFRLDIVPDLFHHDDRTLADAWFPGRRLVVVCDVAAADRAGLLASYLRAAQERGQLDEHLLLDAPLPLTADGMEACDLLLDTAAKLRLGRRDAFVAFGGASTGRLVALAASSYRRWTRTIRIHRDLSSVVTSIQDGVRVGLTDAPITALQRSSRILVDEQGVLTAPADAAEHATMLLLGLLEHESLERLSRREGTARQAEALTTALQLCRTIGPGAPGWFVGTDWQQLAPAGVAAEHRPLWALLFAARVAHRLGLLTADRLAAATVLLQRLDPALPPLIEAWPEPDAVRRWRLRGFPGDREARRVAVPQDDGDPVLIDRRLLASVLPSLPDLPDLTQGPDVPALAQPLDLPVLSQSPDVPALPPPLDVPVLAQAPGAPVPAGVRAAAYAHTDIHVPASFPVRFSVGLLDEDNWDLADLMPVRGQVVAAVDPYAVDQLSRVHRMLGRYRQYGYLSRFTVVPVHATDHAKTYDQVKRITQAAEGLGLGPRDRILVIGGGTVMDIVGYAAYLYRGDTPYVRLPTTLVGMIDAGIGLKVGINVNGHKNLMGAYHPPLACVCDTSFLRTLAPDELRCGLAEAVKISMVCDSALFGLIEARHADLFSGAGTAEARAILDGSIRTMLRQLEANPFEDELRRLPDFGHEFGHMLESLSRFRLRHGEAVSIGMALSSCLAAFAGYLSRRDLDRLLDLLVAGGLPISDQVCDPQVLWAKLRDEVIPHKGGRLHLVVPRAVGVGDFIDSIDELGPEMIRDACALLRERGTGAAS